MFWGARGQCIEPLAQYLLVKLGRSMKKKIDSRIKGFKWVIKLVVGTGEIAHSGPQSIVEFIRHFPYGL